MAHSRPLSSPSIPKVDPEIQALGEIVGMVELRLRVQRSWDRRLKGDLANVDERAHLVAGAEDLVPVEERIADPE